VTVVGTTGTSDGVVVVEMGSGVIVVATTGTSRDGVVVVEIGSGVIVVTTTGTSRDGVVVVEMGRGVIVVASQMGILVMGGGGHGPSRLESMNRIIKPMIHGRYTEYFLNMLLPSHTLR
jgi:hypothetical protein